MKVSLFRLILVNISVLIKDKANIIVIFHFFAFMARRPEKVLINQSYFNVENKMEGGGGGG